MGRYCFLVTTPHSETRRDVEAALAARRELGSEFDEQIAAGLADRVEQLAQQRSVELRRQGQVESHAEAAERTSRTQRFVLGIVSLGAGVPITAIGASYVDPPLLGVLISWGGIVAINAVHALGGRRGRR
jgi:hypothetical protein